MKRLHDLKNQLPGKAKLSIFERMRVKGGENDKRRDRPAGSSNGNGNQNGNGNGGNGNHYGWAED